MDRDQADEIHRHLQAAARAIDRAEMTIFDLGKEGRKAFADPLGNVVHALHFELLPVIYEQFPDMRPRGAEAAITSTLRWDQVRLPSSVTEADVDAIILSAVSSRAQKVGMVVIRALKRVEELGLPISDEVLAARIQVLVEAGRLEGAGDLRKWYNSEVRLKD
jgi:hypothetical protein